MKNNFITKIIGATLATAMMIGVGAGVNALKEAMPMSATAYQLESTLDCADASSIGSNTVYGAAKTSAMDAANVKKFLNNAAGSSIVNSVASNPTKVYWAKGSGGPTTDNENYLKVGAASAAGSFTLTLANTHAEVSKVEVTAVGWKTTSKLKVGTGTQVTLTQSSDTYSFSFTSATRTFSFEVTTSAVLISEIKLYSELSSTQTLSGLRIASGGESVKKVYDDGEAFDPTGLVIQAKWDDEWDTGNDVANDVVWSPDPLTAGITEVTGTYTVGEQNQTVTVNGLTVKAPDVTIDGDGNKPAGLGTDANVTATGEGQINSSGVKYGYCGLCVFADTNNLEFNREVENAYLGNNESYGKCIRKIRVTLLYENNFSKLTMYKGDTKIPGTVSVQRTGSGKTQIYNLGDDSEFFALKQTTTGSWIQIEKIEVFLGSNAPTIDTVTASINEGTYYVGDVLSVSDFTVTVGWTEGKANTNPTEGFTWTVNGIANGQLNEGNNTVVVTYGGVVSDPFNVVGSTYDATRYLNNVTAVATISGDEGYNAGTENETEGIVFANLGLTNGVQYLSPFEIGNGTVTITFDGGANDGKYYTTGAGIRVYGGGSFTVAAASPSSFSRIEFTWDTSESGHVPSTDDIADKGTYNHSTNVWTGNETSVTFARPSGSGHWRLKTVTVTYVGTVLSVNNVKLRFGASIPKTDWDTINTKWTIDDYGVMFMKKTTLQNNYEGKSIAEAYFNDGLRPSADIHKGSGETPCEEGNNYVFTARINMTNENNYNVVYVAAPYIVASGQYFFLTESEGSVNSVATECRAHGGSSLTNAALDLLTGN